MVGSVWTLHLLLMVAAVVHKKVPAGMVRLLREADLSSNVMEDGRVMRG